MHAPLLELGRRLQSAGYRFTTITPASHERVNRRPSSAKARTLTDVFGWSRPFEEGVLPKDLFQLLQDADAVERRDGLFRSKVRFSSLRSKLFVHSAFPTTEEDSVFFGPDTYRYAQLLSRMHGWFKRAVDIGAGSGAGLLSIAERCDSLIFTDINDRALRFAKTNAELANATGEFIKSDVLKSVEGDFDLIISNPPYLVDPKARAYRHGGERGIELPLRIVAESTSRVRKGGVLCIYTGTPVVDGEDLFRKRALPLVKDFDVHYDELDVDVFGEELDDPAYGDVDRIALVSLTATRRS